MAYTQNLQATISNMIIHKRAWFARRNAHYKAVKAKTMEDEEVQKMKDKPLFHICSKTKIYSF